MTPLETILQIPEWIAKGLADGSLVRNAAGVVRAAGSHPRIRPGAIVAHLREIPAVESVQGVSAAPALSFGLQLATLYYLKVRFDRIERTLDSLALHVRCLGRDVSALRVQNTEFFTAQVAGALEQLIRFERTSSAPASLERAHDGIVDCTGQLSYVLAGMDAEALTERPHEARALLLSLELAARVELRCLMHRGAPQDDVAFVLSRHAASWQGAYRRLESRTAATARMPTVRQLRAIASGEVTSLHLFLSNGVDTLAGELAIHRTFAAMPSDRRTALLASCNTTAQLTLCALAEAA